MRAINRQTDAVDGWYGRLATPGGGFRPIVLNATVTANRGDLSAILALNVSREHGCTCPFKLNSSQFGVTDRELVQNLCQNRDGGDFHVIWGKQKWHVAGEQLGR